MKDEAPLSIDEALRRHRSLRHLSMAMESAEYSKRVSHQVLTLFEREHAILRHAVQFPHPLLETGLSPEHFEVRDHVYIWQTMQDVVLGRRDALGQRRTTEGAVAIGTSLEWNTLHAELQLHDLGIGHAFHGAAGQFWHFDLYGDPAPTSALYALRMLVPALFARYRLRQQRKRFEALVDRVDKEIDPVVVQRDWQEEAERVVNEPDGGEVGTTISAMVRRHDPRDKSGKNMVPLGFMKIDRANGGGHGRGDMCVIGGGTNHGKSYAAQRLLRLQAQQGRAALHISVEDGEDLMAARMIADFSRQVVRDGIGPAELRSRTADPEAVDRAVALVVAECGDLIRYVDAPKAKVSEVCRIMRRNRVLFQVDLVIVDYLQAIQADEPTNSRANDVAIIVSALKKCAKDIGVALVVMSQYSREEYKDGAEPTINACKWAGEIENESEIMFLLWRDDNDVLHGKVAKLKWSKATMLRFTIETDPKTGGLLDWHDDFGPTQNDRRDRRRARDKPN